MIKKSRARGNAHGTALTFVLAPVPNSICSRCARADDISPEYNSAYVDFGRFLTGMLVVSQTPGHLKIAKRHEWSQGKRTECCSMDKRLTVQTTGLSLPVLLAHSALITPAACWMSMAGGGLVYGTILVYSGWFGVGDDDEF